MLYYDGNKQEAITILTGSEQGFGNRFAEKALATNMIAACYLLLGDYERTELFLQQSLSYAKKSNTDKVERKVLNNYAVFYQLQGEYGKAINHLKQIADKSVHSNSELLLYMNLGDVFMKNNELDSAKSYYKYVDSLLPTTNVKIETQFSAYDALSKYAKRLHNDSLTIHYCAKRESLLYEIMRQRQEQSIFRIQQQYDYESLQNEMNRKLIRKQRLITFIGLLAIIGLAAVAISQIRLAKTRKQEAEAKNSLFHFMQQNKELVESNMEHEKKALDTTQQLSDLLYARLKAMQKLDYCLKTPKDKIALKDLEKEVFGEGDHWEAIKEVLVALYPGLWEALKLKYPDMDEMERRVFMLSYLKLSRLGEATLLGISTSVLDKLRTKVRKVVEQDIKQ